MTGDELALNGVTLLSRPADNHCGTGDAMLRLAQLPRLGNLAAQEDHPAVTLVVADHHPLVRQGVVHILRHQPGWHVIAEAGTWEDLAAALKLAPSVVIFDSALPCPASDNVAAAIRGISPDSRLVALSTEDSAAQLHHMAASGCHGMLCKSDEPVELVAAVTAAVNGQSYRSASLQGAMAQPADSVVCLPTAREHEVLALIVQGFSNKDLARRLAISIKTVEKHRQALLHKTDTHNALALVGRARELGWI